jgi:nicotinamide phosphoribosyltransferase
MKATYVEIAPVTSNGYEGQPVGREIFKDPITDGGGKKSAKGLLCVVNGQNGYELIDQVPWEPEFPNGPSEDCGALMTIFMNGVFYREQTLTEIRERINTLV